MEDEQPASSSVGPEQELELELSVDELGVLELLELLDPLDPSSELPDPPPEPPPDPAWATLSVVSAGAAYAPMASAQIRTRALRRAGTSSWESLNVISSLVFLSIRSNGWPKAHPMSTTGMQGEKVPGN